ncbi:MAG: GAF domain-containing protein [Sphingobacteriales bacterium]|jgi:L-methionine (R)-S-oxide reductase|nr:GAF domain-containing protein [Sphingobacteriales bacterium]
MAESLQIPGMELTRGERYALLLPQLQALVAGETDRTANLANLMAALKEAMGFFWVGMYIVRAEELVLGPFQGPVACTRIAYGRGVCGSAWKEARVLIVPDVDAFPGHIACSSASRSEIVLPVFANDRVVAVLDVDSDRLNDFSDEDAIGLGEVVKLISGMFF